MADYVGIKMDSFTELKNPDTKPKLTIPYEDFIKSSISVGAEDQDIIQRIWDTTAEWCQYTKSTFDPAPSSGETEPNHTNNLVAGTHQKIGEEL